MLPGSDPVQIDCDYVSTGTLHQQSGNTTTDDNGDNIYHQMMPVIGDVTIASGSVSVSLRCTATHAAASVTGSMIATQVGAITAST